MLVLLEESPCGLTVQRVGVRDRLAIWWGAARLDRALATGASPDSNLQLAARAQALVRPSARGDLAHSIGHLVEISNGRAPVGQRSVPLCRDRVNAVAAELRSLVDRLLSPGPVSARGVAQVRGLLRDGSGPLYNRGSTDDLRAQVQEAVEALHPLGAA